MAPRGSGRPRRARARRTFLASLVALALVGCGGGGAAPTAAPDDVFVVVTPTLGPPPPRTPTAVPAEQRYVVREGDSLSVIATRFGVEEDVLRRLNGIDDPNSIYAGQELVIPPPEP